MNDRLLKGQPKKDDNLLHAVRIEQNHHQIGIGKTYDSSLMTADRIWQCSYHLFTPIEQKETVSNVHSLKFYIAKLFVLPVRTIRVDIVRIWSIRIWVHRIWVWIRRVIISRWC